MMETQLKQRLVGGVVIVCVLAIFLPILLHKPKSDQAQSVPMTIPKPQTISEMSLQLPEAQPSTVAPKVVATATDKLMAAQAAVVQPVVAKKAPSKAHTAAVAPHTINTKILQSAIATPQAWVVQLGSFSQAQHAHQLVKQLRERGFDAYSRSTDLNHQRIVRVFVGPEINLQTMRHINKKLQHDFHLRGVVRKYSV